MKKYLMSLAALMITLSASMLTSCNPKNEPENVVTPGEITPEPGTHVETLTIAFPNQEQTRVAIDEGHNLTGWEEGDEVQLVQTDDIWPNPMMGYEEYIIIRGIYTFTCTDAANGTFTGTLPNGTSVNDCQLAFYNVDNIEVCSSFPKELLFSPKTRASQNMKDVVMMVAKNKEGQFEMEIFGSILKVSNYTDADVTASVKIRWSNEVHYYHCNGIMFGVSDFEDFEVYTYLPHTNHSITLSKDVPTYVYIPVYNRNNGNANYAVGVSAAGDAENECSIVPFKTNPGNAKLFKASVGTIAAWETPLTLDKQAKHIVIQTGVDISSYTADATHKKLNAAGTLWEVVGGDPYDKTISIQTSANKILGHNSFNGVGLFEGYSKVDDIRGLAHIDFRDVTDMRDMFYNCTWLTTIEGLTSMNTSSVTNMSYMFGGCQYLHSLDLSNFNTSNVTNMSGMFYTCIVLEELRLSANFVITNETNVAAMLVDCGQRYYMDRGGKCKIYGATDDVKQILVFKAEWNANHMMFAD